MMYEEFGGNSQTELNSLHEAIHLVYIDDRWDEHEGGRYGA